MGWASVDQPGLKKLFNRMRILKAFNLVRSIAIEKNPVDLKVEGRGYADLATPVR